MKTIKLQTTIMCDMCIAKVTPALDEVAGQGNWTVDIRTPKKILTVTGEHIEKEQVIGAVQKAGYTAEELS